MPRRKLGFAKGHYYHIFNRGTDKRTIFHEKENYLLLLRQVKKYAQMFQISVIAYCLMPNHYHFLLRQDGDAAIGTFIHRIFNSYVKAFNKRYGRQGTLFESRFKSLHVSNNHYLLQACCYIHANPVKDGLVTQPEAWPYSNYLEWIGERDGTLIDQGFVRDYYPIPKDYAATVYNYLLGRTELPEDTRKILQRLTE